VCHRHMAQLDIFRVILPFSSCIPGFQYAKLSRLYSTHQHHNDTHDPISTMANITNPPAGYRSWGSFCYLNPSDPACEDIPGFYGYDISLGANAALLALFVISLIGFIGTFAATRRGKSFTFAFIAGVILEILGYAGRLMSYKNRFDENGFLMQICCLTIAPAFLAGGIYLCLRRIVYAFGPENSRIKPETYTRLVSPSFPGSALSHLLYSDTWP